MTVSPTVPTLLIPDPEAIRAAIDATDERSRLLRRLLRLAMRLRLHLTTAEYLPTLITAEQAKGGGRG